MKIIELKDENTEEFINMVIQLKSDDNKNLTNQLNSPFSLVNSNTINFLIQNNEKIINDFKIFQKNESAKKIINLYLKLSNITYNDFEKNLKNNFYLLEDLYTILNTGYSINEIQTIINLLKNCETKESKKIWRSKIILHMKDLDKKIRSIIRDYCFSVEDNLKSSLIGLTYQNNYEENMYEIICNSKSLMSYLLKYANEVLSPGEKNTKNENSSFLKKEKLQEAISKFSFEKLIHLMKKINIENYGVFLAWLTSNSGTKIENIDKLNVTTFYSSWKKMRNIVSHNESFFISNNRSIMFNCIRILENLSDKNPNSKSNKFILELKSNFNSKILKLSTKYNIPFEIVNMYII